MLAYRNRTNDETRNIHLIDYDNSKWQELGPIADDKWHISGCPVNGPALAGDDENVGIIWVTAPEGQSMIKFNISKDSGVHFDEAVVLSNGIPLGRVDLAFYDGYFFGSWIEMDESAGCSLVIHKIDHDNESITTEIYSSDISCDRGSGYPQIEVWGDQLLILWTEPGETAAIAGEWIQLN